MKMTIRGTVTQIGEPRVTDKSEVTEIIINKKYHDPETGELKAEDNYPCQIWKKQFLEFEKCYHKNSMMEVTGFLNGRKVDKDGRQSFFLNFVGTEFKNT